MLKTQRRDRVLTWVLPLLPVTVALVLLGLVLLAAERTVGEELTRRAHYRVEQAGGLYADQLARLLARRSAELELLGAFSRTSIRDEAWRGQMQRLKATSGSYVWIGVTDAYGDVRVATDGVLEGASIDDLPLFQQGRNGLWFGSLHAPMALAEPLRSIGLPVPAELADIASPLFDDEGHFAGVIAAHLDASYFEERRQGVLGPVAARRLLEVALVDADGRVLLGGRPAVPENVWRSALLGIEGATSVVTDMNGQAVLLSRAPVRPADSALRTTWQVVAWQPLDAALQPVHQLERSLATWGGLTALAIGLIGFAVSRRLARPYSESEKHLREQGEVLTAVINAASDAVISVDEHGLIELFNPAAARIFGHPPERMIGRPLDTLLPPGTRASHVGYLRRFADAQATTRPMGAGRVAGLRADGETLELEASISQITVRGRKLLTAILRDVTERGRAERALERYQHELSELTQRLLNQEKQTTRRLAQTLHDQLGQTLGAIRLSYDAFSGLVPQTLSPKARERERKLGDLIDQAIAEVRQALVALRPPLLEEAGLLAALDNELRSRAVGAEPVGLRLDVAPGASRVRWPADVEYAAFMVAREALANALLHADAAEVVVHIDGTARWLHLAITDDGVGLDASLAAGRPGHLGIVGMRERAHAIGAQLVARRRAEGGTVISLTWGHPPAGTSPG